jgi:hypothetical protein
MKKMLFAVPAMMVALVVQAAAWGGPPMISGSGSVSSKDYTVSSFDTVSLMGIPDFRIIPGDTPAVSVNADSNIADHLMVNSYGNRLEVSMDPAYSYRPTSFELDITMPTLAAAAIYDSKGSVGQFGGNNIRLDVQGKSNVDLSKVDPNSLALNVADTSMVTGSIDTYRTNLTLAGRAQASLQGASDLVALRGDGWSSANLKGLDANRARLHLKFDSSAQINGNAQGMQVTGAVLDSAHVSYAGNARVDTLWVDTDSGASISRG